MDTEFLIREIIIGRVSANLKKNGGINGDARIAHSCANGKLNTWKLVFF